jgi:putative spermidine/putrescine transport system permease protein
MLRLLQIIFFQHVAGGLMGPVLTFENYTDFLGDRYYIDRLLQTLLYGVIVTGSCFVLGFPLSFTLVRAEIRARPLLLGIVLYPLLTNALALVFAWLVILGQKGPINQFLALIIPDGEPLGILGTPTAVLIGRNHAALPFMVIPLIAAISNISPSLEDSASSLGASRTQVLLQIVVPLAMPGITGGSVITFTTLFSGFLFPLYLGSNSTNISQIGITQSRIWNSGLNFGIGKLNHSFRILKTTSPKVRLDLLL